MGKPAFDIRDSPTLKLAQRIACSGFSLAVLGGDYVEGSSCWKKLEPRLAALQPQHHRGAALLTAKAFRDGWRLRYRLQPATVAAMANFGKGPSFLSRLSRLERVCASELRRDEYIPTLLTAALALEWMRPEPKATVRVAKRRRALQVIDRLLARWKPARNRRIELPPFEFAGLLDHKSAHLSKRGVAHAAVQDQLRDVQVNLAAHVVRPSAVVAASYPSTDPYRAIDYLLRLGLDEAPLTDPALLRWGLDLVSCLFATQALFICDADQPDFGTFHRKRADAVLGLAQFFFGDGTDLDPVRSVRASKLVSLLAPDMSDARRLAFETTFNVARLQFQLTMRSWGVEVAWFRELWDGAHGRLPSSGFPRLGRPPGYVRAAARHAEAEWAQARAELEKALATAATPEADMETLAQEWAAQNPELHEALNAVETGSRPFFDRLTASLHQAGALAEKFRPGYPMQASDYADLVRVRALHEEQLRQCARNMPREFRKQVKKLLALLPGARVRPRRPAVRLRRGAALSRQGKTR